MWFDTSLDIESEDMTVEHSLSLKKLYMCSLENPNTLKLSEEFESSYFTTWSNVYANSIHGHLSLLRDC